VNSGPEIWFGDLTNSDSDFALCVRNLIWLHSIFNSYTIPKSTKQKTFLAPLYVDSVVSPILASIQKFLLENQNFLVEKQLRQLEEIPNKEDLSINKENFNRL
jgi:hypothetical protein